MLLRKFLNDACVRDCSGKPTATRNEWRGLGTESPTRLQAGHAQKEPYIHLLTTSWCKFLFTIIGCKALPTLVSHTIPIIKLYAKLVSEDDQSY